MGKIKNIGLRVNAVDKRESVYQSLVLGITKLNEVESSMVIATALVYNSINIYTGVFSTPTRADVEDIKKIAIELLFEINDTLPVNVELIKVVLSNTIDRLIPEVDTNIFHMITYDRLFTTANVADSEIVDSINNQLYYSDGIFTGVRKLFSIRAEDVKYEDETQSLYIR